MNVRMLFYEFLVKSQKFLKNKNNNKKKEQTSNYVKKKYIYTAFTNFHRGKNANRNAYKCSNVWCK